MAESTPAPVTPPRRDGCGLSLRLAAPWAAAVAVIAHLSRFWPVIGTYGWGVLLSAEFLIGLAINIVVFSLILGAVLWAIRALLRRQP